MSRGRKRQAVAVKGLSSVRKALRHAPDSIRKEVAQTIEDLSTETEQVMRFMAPHKEGDLISSITHVTSTDGLSSVIGPGIRGATTVKKRSGSYFATVGGFKGGVGADIQTGAGKRLRFSGRTNFDRLQLMKAYWLEVGTKRAGRHPFVAPTYDSMRGKISAAISMAVDIGLERALRA